MDIDVDKIPLSSALLQQYSNMQALEYALSGGDDYQLAYTAKHCDEGFEIGKVVTGSKVSVAGYNSIKMGFQHF